MKDFLKLCKPKKLNKAELAELIDEFQKEVIDFYIKKNHLMNKPEFNEQFKSLYDKMSSPKFVKALKYMLKNEDFVLDYGFVVIINGFIEKVHGDESVPDEVIAEYGEIVNKLLKKPVKKISSKIGLDKDTIVELLVVAPSREYISADKFVGLYSQKMLRKLYAIAATRTLDIEDTKQIKKLFGLIFGKDLVDLIAINVLLEKRDSLRSLNDKQQAVWNLMTTFALDVIESQDKNHVGELIEEYCRRRINDSKNNKDTARRVQLTSVDAEDYPKISKVVGKMSKNEKFKKYL